MQFAVGIRNVKFIFQYFFQFTVDIKHVWIIEYSFAEVLYCVQLIILSAVPATIGDAMEDARNGDAEIVLSRKSSALRLGAVIFPSSQNRIHGDLQWRWLGPVVSAADVNRQPM